jgi:N-acetyl-gamma-glutamyl-phosphate reductase
VSSLALAPAVAAGLIEPDVVVVAATGTSGAGKSLKPNLLGSEIMGNVSAYNVGGIHRHTPEIAQNLAAVAGGPVAVSFTPMLVPMPRGILATCTAKVRPGVGAAELRAAYDEAYTGEQFVTLLPEGRWPTTAAVLGSNSVQLQVTVDPAAGRAVIIGAVDNLAKGTAGAAVQCANIALGLPEDAGLTTVGIAP